MAFEPRFAVALIGSSGEGGASLYRRNFGEVVENPTGSGEYHWMAGNFLKYGAAESSFTREWEPVTRCQKGPGARRDLAGARRDLGARAGKPKRRATNR